MLLGGGGGGGGGGGADVFQPLAIIDFLQVSHCTDYMYTLCRLFPVSLL